MGITKKLLITSGCIIGIGVILSLSGFAAGGQLSLIRDNSGFKIYDNEKQISKSEDLDKFNSIEIKSNIDNVQILKSDKYAIEIKYGEGSGEVNYSVNDGKLVVKQEESQNNMINFNIGLWSNYTPSYMKIYVPNDSNLDNMNLRLNIGDLTIENINADEVNVECLYGDLRISNMNSKKMNLSGSNNSVFISNIISDEMSIKSAYGDIKVDNVNTKLFSIKTTNGNMRISDVEASDSATITNSYGDIFIADSNFKTLSNEMNNGEFRIEESSLEKLSVSNQYGDIRGGNLVTKGIQIKASNSDISLTGELKGDNNISTQYGDIDITTSIKEEMYSYSVDGKYGDIRIAGKDFDGDAQKANDKAENKLDLSSTNGDIRVDFK